MNTYKHAPSCLREPRSWRAQPSFKSSGVAPRDIAFVVSFNDLGSASIPGDGPPLLDGVGYPARHGVFDLRPIPVDPVQRDDLIGVMRFISHTERLPTQPCLSTRCVSRVTRCRLVVPLPESRRRQVPSASRLEVLPPRS